MNKEYVEFITDLKQRIVQSRYNAARLANREQLMLYLKTGQLLTEKIAAEKWGAKIVKEIADELQKQLPGLRGFSYRNLLNMRRFYVEYQGNIIVQSVTAQIKENHDSLGSNLIELFWQVSFTHHMMVLNRCRGKEEKFFYIEQAATQCWSVNVLEHYINSDLYANQGKLPNNFSSTLQGQLKDSALRVFQDDYLMDFIGSGSTDDDERVFEDKVVADIKNFILRLGKGFCFIGNQYRLEVGGEEFFVDLLFFNRHLRSLVAFELKRGKFKPEYAGQLNFYLNVLDEKVRTAHENASIGIVLCKEKNNTVVEFAVRTIDKAMGVATYRTTREMPAEMQGILPDTGALARLL
jgi:predicted nuclease of restriction endonuclease-like (RecB) superfamily